jgi:hypothetical protein
MRLTAKHESHFSARQHGWQKLAGSIMENIKRTKFEWFVNIGNRFFRVIVVRRKVVNAIIAKLPTVRNAD